MSREEVELLALQPKKNFRDITGWIKELTVPTPPPLPNQPQQKTLVNSLLPNLQVSNLESIVKSLSSFQNRYYTSQTGVEAAKWIEDTLISYAGARVGEDVSVSLFANTPNFAQPSVIARIKGVSASTEVVIIGAHEDSIASRSGDTMVAPGADDDASGCASSLEVFRVLMQAGYHPNRTIEFHYYAGEEEGLLGSKAIAQDYATKGVNVVGMLQLDMTMFIGRNPGDTPIIALVTDFVDDDLTAFLRILADAYSTIPWVDTLCGYGCSDHASWNAQGYRSSFPFEASFNNDDPWIHSGFDTLSTLTVAHGLDFSRVGLGFIVELGATSYLTDQ